MYRVIWDKAVLQDLKLLDRTHAIKLVKKVEEYLVKAPEELGKPLVGRFKGLYRYRLGDYRVVYEINKKEVVIIIVQVGHRREVYN